MIYTLHACYLMRRRKLIYWLKHDADARCRSRRRQLIPRQISRYRSIMLSTLSKAARVALFLI